MWQDSNSAILSSNLSRYTKLVLQSVSLFLLALGSSLLNINERYGQPELTKCGEIKFR